MVADRYYGRWRVKGRRAYRDHEPGTEFVAILDGPVAARAVRRGSIELLERIEFGLHSAQWVLPSALCDSIRQRETNREEVTR